MKKLLLVIIAVLSLMLIFTACGDDDKIVYHAVIFDSDGGTPYPGRTIEDGALIMPPENPVRPGYKFCGWYSNGELWDFDTNRVRKNVTLIAKWERISYVVSFESDGIVILTETVEEGNLAAKPIDPTKENHRFLGWYYGSTEWNFNASKVTETLTLVAKWEPYPTFTVSFDSNGGSPIQSVHVSNGSLISAPEIPTRENHKFLGWFNGDTEWDFDTPITDNITLTAKWESTLTYEVTFNPDNGDAKFSEHILASNKIVAPTEPTKAHHKFLGWFNGETKWDFDTPITSDITLVAKWESTLTYKVTFNPDNASGIFVQNVLDGKLATLPTEPTKANCKFLGWFNGDTKWDFDTPITSDITLVAKWESTLTYKVTFNPDNGNSVSSVNVPEGQKVKEPTAPTKANHKFLGWFNGETKWNFDTPVTSDITLVAKWENTLTYKVTFNPNNGDPVIIKDVSHGNKVSEHKLISTELQRFVEWQYAGERFNFDTPITSDIELVAKWDIYHELTIDDGVNTPTKTVLKSGSIITLPDEPTRDGYRFKGWYYGDKKWDFANDKITSNMVLKASWIEIKTCTVTFDANGGSPTPAPQSWPDGSSIKEPNHPKKDDANFLGWYYGDKLWDFGKDKITANIVLVAKWQAIYTVTFNSDGGSAVASQKVVDGGKVTRPSEDPTKANNTFKGWVTLDGRDWNFSVDTVSSNIELKAKWEPFPTYTVTFDSDGGSEVAEKNIVKGGLVQKPENPTKAEYTFKGWVTLDGREWNFLTDKVESDVTLKAKWEPIPKYTVTFDSDGGTPIASQIILNGECAQKPKANPTKINNRFISWQKDGVDWDFNTPITSDITLKAKWEESPKYTVTFDSNGGTAIPSQTVFDGNTALRPTDPIKAGFSLVGWYTADGTEWNFSTPIKSHITLTARWQQLYTVSFNTNGAGDIPSQYVSYSNVAIKPEDPIREGYEFYGWFVGNTEWVFTNGITENVTLTAKWGVTVKFLSNGGSSVAEQKFEENNYATEPTEPIKDGYKFIGWYLGAEKWSFTTTKVTTSIILSAKWQAIYTVTFNSNGGDEIASTTVLDGNKVEKPQDPKRDGYAFDGWYLGEKKWNFDTDKVTANINLKAQWIPYYTVSFNANGGNATISSLTILKGNTIAEPSNPTKDHHDFAGWYLGEVEWKFSEHTVEDNITLTARWNEHTKYTVTFKVGEETTLIEAQTLYVGSLISEPDRDSVDKLRIKEWYLGDKIWDFATDTLTENITLTAKTVNLYTVTFDTDGADPIAPIKVEEGELITGVSDPNKGLTFIFEGWIILGSDKEWNMDSDKVTQDIVLRAEYSITTPPDIWG